MSPYAEGTAVPIDRSRAEIERTLERFGAGEFMYAQQVNAFVIAFTLHGRTMRFIVRRANANDDEIRLQTRKGSRIARRLPDGQAEERAAQENRRRWRSLVLILKAKLEAVHAGIVTMEEEFLPYMQLADGSTVAEWAAVELKPALEGGRMPRAMLGSGK